MIDSDEYKHYKQIVQIIKDGAGRNVDPEMEDVLVGLWLHGLWTHSSCWGHTDGFRYPFIMIPRDDGSIALARELTANFDLNLYKSDNTVAIVPSEISEYYLDIENQEQKDEFLRNLPECRDKFKRLGIWLLETVKPIS